MTIATVHSGPAARPRAEAARSGASAADTPPAVVHHGHHHGHPAQTPASHPPHAPTAETPAFSLVTSSLALRLGVALALAGLVWAGVLAVVGSGG